MTEIEKTGKILMCGYEHIHDDTHAFRMAIAHELARLGFQIHPHHIEISEMCDALLVSLNMRFPKTG